MAGFRGALLALLALPLARPLGLRPVEIQGCPDACTDLSGSVDCANVLCVTSCAVCCAQHHRSNATQGLEGPCGR